MTAVIICSDFGAPQNKVCHCFHCFPIYLPGSDGTRRLDLTFFKPAFLLSFFEPYIIIFKPAFLLPSFTFIKVLFSSSSLSALHKGHIICISEVMDISPGNLDSSLCFIQSSTSHDVLCIEVK